MPPTPPSRGFLDRAIDISTWDWAEKALAVCLALFAVAIGVIGIRRPIFIDEAYSILISSYDLRGVIDHLRNDSNLPLYYILLHAWIRWFGISEIAARVPSILFYFLGMVAAFQLGEQVSRDRRIGLYTAFFYGAGLQAVHIAQKARVYSLLGLVATISILLFFRCFWKGTGRWQDWVLYIAVNVVGSFTHVWFAFLLFAQLVCYLIFFPRITFRRFLASMALSGIPFLLLWARFLPQQAGNGSIDWIPAVDIWTAPGAVLEFYGGMKIGALFLLACGLLLFVKERGDPRKTADGESRAQWALLLIFVLSIGVPLTVSIFKPIYWPGRYTIIALPSLALLLAWRLATTVRHSVLAGFACAVLAAVLVLHVVNRRDIIENSEATLRYADSDKHVTEELLKRIHPGDTLIFTGLSRASIQYYFRLYHRDQDVTWISYPAENAEHLGWDNDRIDRATLEAEAGRIAGRLSRSGAGNSQRFWILVGQNQLADDTLFAEMDRHFSMLGVLKVRGAFFSVVGVYRNTPPQPSSSQ